MGTAHTLSTKGIATLNCKTQKRKTHSLFLDLMSIMSRTIGTSIRDKKVVLNFVWNPLRDMKISFLVFIKLFVIQTRNVHQENPFEKENILHFCSTRFKTSNMFCQINVLADGSSVLRYQTRRSGVDSARRGGRSRANLLVRHLGHQCTGWSVQCQPELEVCDVTTFLSAHMSQARPMGGQLASAGQSDRTPLWAVTSGTFSKCWGSNTFWKNGEPERGARPVS